MTSFLINQCQMITFLILKSDNIENSRIELKGIVLQVRSNQIKVTFIIILPFNLVHLWFFPVSHRNWRKMWVGYWEGGVQRVCCPPSQSNYWGASPPPLFLRLCVVPSTHIRIAYDFCHHPYIHSKELKWLHQKLEFKVFIINSQHITLLPNPSLHWL